MTPSIIHKNEKTIKIIYWVSTILIVLLDSVIPALTFNTVLAKEGIRHLGFPDYFRIELSIGKIIGGILLIIPAIPSRFKEWAYVGFGITLISGIIANYIVDGVPQAAIPLIGVTLISISYVSFHKMQNEKLITGSNS